MQVDYIIIDKDTMNLNLNRHTLLIYGLIRNYTHFGGHITKAELYEFCEKQCNIPLAAMKRSINSLIYQNLVVEELSTTFDSNKIITRYIAKAPEDFVPVEKTPKPKNTKKKEELQWFEPTYEEVFMYAQERCCESIAQQFYDYYTKTGWKTKKGVHVKDWKKRFVEWEQRNGKDSYHPVKTVE